LGLGSVVEQALAEHLPEDIDVDVYAVDHHGSKESSDLCFLRALKPEYAICQSGETNSYSHPNEEAVERILSVTTTDGVSPRNSSSRTTRHQALRMIASFLPSRIRMEAALFRGRSSSLRTASTQPSRGLES
jgi:hypothetical protein